jgi:hypothetical protein
MLKQKQINTLVMCAVSILIVEQPVYTQNSDFKITPDDGSVGDNFGVSTAISDDYAVVGAWHDDDNGSNSGSAYVFKRTGSAWSQEAKLLPDDGDIDDEFGYPVSISGDYVVIGARHDDDNGSNSGSAYVFKRTGTSWTQEAKLLPDDGDVDDLFGFWVSISNEYAIIGAQFDDDNGSNSGSAYVFKRTGTSWTQEAKLLPDDGDVDDRFGFSVSISGDYAVVGAYLDDNDNGSNSGSAYIFKRTGTSWNQEIKLLPSDVAANHWFGWNVSISGDYAVVAALKKAAYVFKRTGTGWTQEAKVQSSDLEDADRFGWNVSISGDKVFVGALKNSDNGPWSGSAYLFRHSGAGWTEEAKVISSDAAANDQFGHGASVSGGYGIVGSWLDDNNGTDSGSAYLYGFFTPVISAVTDVPYDQGGSVTLKWNASSLDVNVDSLSYYSIWRALPGGINVQGMEVGITDISIDFSGQAYRVKSFGRNDFGWEWIANQPAHRFDTYTYTAQTLFDSSSTTDGKHYFMVSAHTNQPDLFYDSLVDSGYSIDNIAPAVPTGLLAFVTEQNTIKLFWNIPIDEDFSYFKIYRSLDPDFDPTGTEPFAETIDTTFIDSDVENGETYYYILSAVDFNGNESEYTDATEVTFLSIDDMSGIPAEFGLYQNYPNPFNPITTIRYDLPEQTSVYITIYDLLGRQIITLVNETQEAGYKSIIWDASGISSGIYIYRINAGNFTQTRKLVLLK